LAQSRTKPSACSCRRAKPRTPSSDACARVSAPSYVTAIVVLYVATAILGGWIYPEYRLGVRVVLEQLDLWKANGPFELKEHFVAVGLGMLPAYWYFWRQPLAASFSRERAVITATLAFIVWWSFLVGHILNNIRGFGS